MIINTTPVPNYYDFHDLSSLKASNKEDPSQLKVVARQLEAIFLQMMLKSMHDTNMAFQSEIYDRKKENYYQDMLDHQLSLSLAQNGGIGLAKIIENQLTGIGKVKNHEQSSQKNANAHMPSLELVIQPKPETSFTTKDDFIKYVTPIAEQVSSMIGIDPLLLVAQSALETGWGKNIAKESAGASSYNLFGIKENNVENPRVASQTIEYNSDGAYKERAQFKKYTSFQQSFIDYIELVKTQRYQSALANVSTPEKFLKELQQAGYATDPKYAEKVMQIYKNMV